MDNMYLGMSYHRRRRRKKGPIFIILILSALALGFGGYKLSKFIFEKNETEAETDKVQEHETAVWASADPTSDTNEVYMLWTEPKVTEAPVIEESDDEDVWMKDFVDTRERVTSKGIYISSDYINKRFDEALALLDSTELNTMVIDIINDNGYVTYMMDYDVVREAGICTPTISNISETIRILKEHNVYLIARIVSFRDSLLAVKKPELALKNKDGSIFRDSSGFAWLNPYEDKVWDYLTEICKRCVGLGFNEVNLDYIRFSTDKGLENVDFGPKAETMSRIDVITEGIRKICETIKPMGAFVSCDVYGAIISSKVDSRITGQSYFNMAQYLDYICPMVYPSHYGDGYYGLDHPDCHPYDLVYHALLDSKKNLYMIDPEVNKAEVRPWLQDFTASWLKNHLKYGKDEVRAQINGVYDAGYSQWLLWNAAIIYTKDALEKAN